MAPKKKKSIEELLDQPSRTVEDNRNLITQINQDIAKSKRGKWCKKHMPKAWPKDKQDLFIDPKNGPNKPNETILGEMVAIWINVYKLSKNEELLETTNVETMRNMILKEMEDTDTVKELYKFIREKRTPAAVMVPVDIKEFNSEVPGNPGPGSGLNIVSPLIGVEVAVDKFQRADAAPRSSFVDLHEVSQKNKFIEGCGNQNSEDHTTQLCAKSSLEDVHEVSPEFTSDILKESTPIEGCHNQNDDDHTPVEPAEKNKFIEGCGNQNSEDHTTQLCTKKETETAKDIQALIDESNITSVGDHLDEMSIDDVIDVLFACGEEVLDKQPVEEIDLFFACGEEVLDKQPVEEIDLFSACGEEVLDKQPVEEIDLFFACGEEVLDKQPVEEIDLFFACGEEVLDKQPVEETKAFGKEPSSLIEETADGVQGIDNIGNTCFAGAVYQCLRSSNSFVNTLKDVHSTFTCVPDCFICSLRYIIVNKEQVTRKHVLMIRERWENYEPGTEQDPQEFFMWLLNAINQDTRTDDLGQRSFAFTIKSQLTCLKCKRRNDPVIGTQNLISLPVGKSIAEELRKMGQPEDLTDPTDPKCTSCGCSQSKIEIIQDLPPTFVVHIKRYGANKNQPMPMSRVESLVTSRGSYELRLNAVICHSARGENSGHFVAYVASNDKWYCADDSKVTEANFEYIAQRNGYMCFYTTNFEHGQKRKFVPTKEVIGGQNKVIDVTQEELVKLEKTLFDPEDHESLDFSVKGLQCTRMELEEKIMKILDNVRDCCDVKSQQPYERHLLFVKGHRLTDDPVLLSKIGKGTIYLVKFILRKQYTRWTKSCSAFFMKPVEASAVNLPPIATKYCFDASDYMDKVLTYFVIQNLSAESY